MKHHCPSCGAVLSAGVQVKAYLRCPDCWTVVEFDPYEKRYHVAAETRTPQRCSGKLKEVAHA